MRDKKKNARPVAGTTEQAAGADFAGHVPNFDDTTDHKSTQSGIASLLMHGAENGLHLSDLARLTGWTEREVRKVIHEERRKGVPILSNNKDGCYLPGNETERTHCVRSLRHRAHEILAAAEAIEKTGR